MKLKIQIKTPPGNAQGVEKKLRPFLINRKVALHDIKTNKADDEIVWNIEGPSKYVLKVSRNVYLYDAMIDQVFKNRRLRKMVKKRLSDKDYIKLKKMLLNHTTVKVLKGENGLVDNI